LVFSSGGAALVSSTLEHAATLRVGELARITGKTVRTIHFYEELGLLHPVERTRGGFRLYGEDARVRIHWIERLKELGFSLGEIKSFLESFMARGETPAAMASLREFYERKILETRDGIRRLEALEAELKESLAWLDGCRACVREAGSACPKCAESNPKETPVLVAAMRGPSSLPLP
jgi:DNA-binding transcriptional MerR regulator